MLSGLPSPLSRRDAFWAEHDFVKQRHSLSDTRPQWYLLSALSPLCVWRCYKRQWYALTMHLFPNEKNSFLWTPKAYFPSTPGHFLEGGLKSSSVTHFKLLTFIHNFVLQFTLVMNAAGAQAYEETNICDNQSSPKESTVTFHRQRTFHEIKTFLSINLIMQIISRCRSSTHDHSWMCETLRVR